MNPGMFSFPQNIDAQGSIAIVRLADIVVPNASVGEGNDIKFRNIPLTPYRHLRVVGTVRGNASSGFPAFRCQVSGNGEFAASTLYDQQITYSAGTGAGGGVQTGINHWEMASIPSGAHTAGNFLATTLDFLNHTSTEVFKSTVTSSILAIPGVNVSMLNHGGLWRSFAPITSLRFFCSSGGFAAGSRLTLYGFN